MALGIGFEASARRGERHMLADAGHDVLQGAPFGRVIEHVVGGDQRHARCAGERGEAGEAPRIIAAIEHAGAEPDLRCFAQRLEEGGQRVFVSSGAGCASSAPA